jgi:hypothetical protein
MNGANTWYVCMYFGECTYIMNVLAACIKAKTRDEAIRMFMRIAPAERIIDNIYDYTHDNTDDVVLNNICYEFDNIIKDNITDLDDYSSDHPNYKICEKLYRDLINKHEDYILNFILKNEQKMHLVCELLVFNKIIDL